MQGNSTPLRHLSRRGLDPIKLPHNLLIASTFNRLKPVCQRSW